jgi:hypothetical protein
MKTSFTRHANTIVDTICRVSRDPPENQSPRFQFGSNRAKRFSGSSGWENVSMFPSDVISLREPVLSSLENASATFRPNLGLSNETLLTFTQSFQA